MPKHVAGLWVLQYCVITVVINTNLLSTQTQHNTRTARVCVCIYFPAQCSGHCQVQTAVSNRKTV